MLTKSLIKVFLLGFLIQFVVPMLAGLLVFAFPNLLDIIPSWLDDFVNITSLILAGFVVGWLKPRNGWLKAALLGLIISASSIVLYCLLRLTYVRDLKINIFPDLFITIVFITVGGFIGQKLKERKQSALS